MHAFKERIDHIIEKFLIVLETVIAIFTVLVLLGQLAMVIYEVCAHPDTFLVGEDVVTDYLHHMLNIVIGLEFVKLLMHLTPANILEVLIMAISRGIIISHGDALENLLSILCIVALFAAKRFLIPKAELHKGMDEEVQDAQHHRNFRKNRHKHSEHKPAEQKEPAAN